MWIIAFPRLFVILDDIGLVPFLTDNVDCSGYIVSASSECKTDHNFYKAFKAFNSYNSQWRISNNEKPFWIQIQCLKPVRVYKITVRAAPKSRLVKWKVQGATDGFHTWEDLPFDTRYPISNSV